MKKLEVRAVRVSVVFALAVLANGCGGDGTSATVDVACEGSLMQPMGAVVLPAVESGGRTWQYTLTPMDAAGGQRRYKASRAAVSTTSNCSYAVLEGGVLEAQGIARLTQSVSITLQSALGAPADVFTVVDARARAGNLDGFAGGAMQLTGAKVQVKSAAGQTLLTGTTNEYGAIVSDLGEAGLPDAFRVIVSAGSIDGTPIGGSLVADVTDYSADFSPVLTVTPVTTLVSAWRDRHPYLGAAEAAAAVRGFLKFPENQEMDSDHESSEDYFDTAAFYAQARAAGGIDPFVAALMGEWSTGVEHAFVPVEPDRDGETSPLARSMLPEGSLPMRAGARGGMLPKDLSLVASLVGKVWESYENNKTKQFQADTISLLQRIDSRLSDLKSRSNITLLAVKQASYSTKMTPMFEFAAKVRPAMDALRLLAAYPNAGLIATLSRVKLIKDLTGAGGIPLGFPEVLRGSFVGDEAAPGSLQLYRESERLRVTEATNAQGDALGYRKIFSYADSWRMWDYFRYWSDIQTIGYFFWNEALRASEREDEAITLTNDFTNLLEVERAQMPKWALNSGAHLDVRGEDYYGNPAVGPLVWFVAGIFGNQCASDPIAFDAGNNNVRSLINARLNCFNNPAHLGGVGGWRLPTFKEWEVFTLTAGSPSRDVGAWLEERGVIHAKDMNDKFFYAQIGTSCSDPVVKDKYNQTCLSGGVNIFLANKDSEGHIIFPAGCGTRCNAITTNYWYSDYYQGSWEPFLWFNHVHKPGAWRESGYKGHLIPVRAAGTNEFL